ncbi:expressed unknown protein [Seminavis robusta]|uniref:Uncharacterized protein n=1 Tax=Seminavis robusta TaxID=568900 RepID=A0A9N8DR86_9STRA|nr:expressed unknown protein [Seminavis robusta]|eukprot:Sro295_g110380.1 n/a (262) ;mRNA; r:19290-20075
MREQQQRSTEQGKRTWATSIHLVTITVVLIVFLSSDITCIGNKTASNWEQLRSSPRLNRHLEGTAAGDNEDIPDGGEIQRADIDPEVVGAFAAVVAGAILVPATFFGALLSGKIFSNSFIHEVPSKIKYTLPTSVSLRELSNSEQDDLETATANYYDALLRGAHSEVVSVTVTSINDADSTEVFNPVVALFQLIFGPNHYGYTWKFEIFIGVTSTRSLTLGEAVATLEGADMSVYVNDYLKNLGSSNMLANTESAAYSSHI